MPRATGIGGVFFRSPDPERLHEWYREHLGLAPDASGTVVIAWNDDPRLDDGGHTVWAPFPADTDYFGSDQRSMINYRVDDLDGLIAQLEAAGVEVLPQRQDSEYGRFAWAIDCDGNRFEMWQPPTR